MTPGFQPAPHADRVGGVHVRGLTRRFGYGAPVLDRLDLTIEAGSFVALLGRSGSGKTTLLRALAGLDPVPEDGAVDVPHPVAVAFQEPRLLPWKPVWRNVALGLAGPDARGPALARALVREPRLLLLDEPFAAVDALTRLRMHRLVLDLWERHRPATLLVTHDVDEAVLLADRVLVLDRGRIALDLPNPEPRPRRPAGEGFAALRGRLLAALGVEGAVA